jgi:xanthine dehydrogenase molybdenum-binding subunit
MDELARELGMDAIELRRINALRVGSTTNTGQVLRESVGLLECLDKVEKEIKKQEPGEGSETFARFKRAWGLACGYKNTGLGGGAPDKAGAEIEVYADGHAEVRTSSAELGQGLPGVLAAITAEELGLPFEHVSILLSDTDRTPNGGPTTASRQTFVSGNAARHASIQMRQVLTQVAAERLDAPPEQIAFIGGQVCIRRNGDSVSEPCATFGQIVQWAQAEGRPTRLTFEYEAPKTQPLGTGGDMHFAFSYATQAALVEVDTETGEVKVLKIVAAHDVGRAINPLSLEGQVEGGIVMGLGNALTEEYIVENGVPYTQWFSRYKMPSIRHTPQVVSLIIEDPAAEGPYGAKGVGELASIPTTPAITNAIYNAIGVRVCSLPVDQDWLLRVISQPSAIGDRTPTMVES